MGATGLVGSHLLKKLTRDDYFDEVIVLTRRSVEMSSPKIKEIILDFDSLDQFEKELYGDIVFCCLGTTIKKAGSKAAFRKVDHDYPAKLAKITKKNGASKFILISALGADSDSFMFYNRVKGEVQEAIKEIHFKTTHFIQPSLLLGDRDEKRVLESFFAAVSPILNTILVGPFKKYQAIAAKQVAKAMLKISKNEQSGLYIHQNDSLKDY